MDLGEAGRRKKDLKPTRRDVAVAAIALTVALAFYVAAGVMAQAQVAKMNDKVTVTGSLSVYKDGQLVYNSPDVVAYPMYGYVACKLFNATNGCGQSSTSYTGSSGCSSLTGTGTYETTTFVGNSLCSLTGIGVSTSSSAPTQAGTTCGTILTTGGFAPVHATVAFTENTNTVSLTATWTATAAESNLQQVYLFPYNDHTGTVVYQAGSFSGACVAVAADTFTPQTAAIGQSLSVTWTFSF